jgi:hypothetical protein
LIGARIQRVFLKEMRLAPLRPIHRVVLDNSSA